MELRLPEEKRYLLVPEMPTPNGRMHLGHVAGPYLKMDVIRRKVERGGGTAYMMSGSDVYESYVELKAAQLHTSTEAVCNHFHELIVKDLEALHIKFDHFINPLDAQWKARFDARQRELMQLLCEAGAVVERSEAFPYDPVAKRFLNGCWIQGTCPNCSSSTGSYLCEICGTHYRPQDIFDAARYPEAVMIQGTALYLQLDEAGMMARLEQMSVGNFKEIFSNYIRLQGPFIRLTTPQATGVSWAWNDQEQVIFTYSGLLFFSIFCADILLEQKVLGVHPFATGSDFVTIASFGIDNAIPYLAAVLGGGMALPGFKPFDDFCCNYFYYLNGEKFSTSRLHVIWAADIVNTGHVQPDAVRYYLLKKNPEFEITDFDVSDFVETVNNDLYESWNHLLSEACGHVVPGKHYEIDEFINCQLESVLLMQAKVLEPGNFHFAQALEPVEEWFAVYADWEPSQKKVHSYWWLKGFAFLCYPVTPLLATALWNHLTNQAPFTKKSFFNRDYTNEDFSLRLFEKVDTTLLASCLPEKLKGEFRINNETV